MQLRGFMASKGPGIISQARMTSTRLPGKVLMKVAGKTLLEYHIERLRLSGLPVVVATTTNETDEPIVDLCNQLQVPVYRGDENDVLSRFWETAEKFQIDPIVRVTSDCPLIDGKMIAQAVQQYLESKKSWLYLSNCLERTYPRGFDFEVFSREMLNEAFEKAQSLPEREHVTPYIHQNHHGKTKLQSIKRSTDMSAHRLTVDELDDFRLIEKLIIDYSAAEKSEREISQILIDHPELQRMNSHIEQKKV